MIANHIHDALAQVRKLQEFILEKRFFKGYSGVARMVGGTAAMAGAVIMAQPSYPASPLAHLVGWGGVLAVGLGANYGALVWWFSSSARREITKAMPVIDAVPALAVGAIFSLAMILGNHYELLYGTWMCMYGLAHVSYRQSLPMPNYVVGIYYITCGAACLLLQVPITDPWPMGLVFFSGEMIGGVILCRNNNTKRGADANADSK